MKNLRVIECYLQRSFFLQFILAALLTTSTGVLGQSVTSVTGKAVTRSGTNAKLHLQIVDETGNPIWAHIEVRGSEEKMYQPIAGLRDRTVESARGGKPFYLGSFDEKGECEIELPPGSYVVVVEHGLEYERIERVVEVHGPDVTEVQLRLQPWIRMRDLNWWSGDMHVHRPPEDAPYLALAEDVNFCVVTTTWPHSQTPNTPAGGDFEGRVATEPVVTVDKNHLVTFMNDEDERGGGAWMLQMLSRPLKLENAAWWYPPGTEFVKQARAQRPTNGILPWFDSEKPIWWEVPVMVALATPDSFGVLNNQFMQYGIDAKDYWGRPRDQKQFPGSEGWVKYLLSLYYRYLNLGFHMPASAGTASGVLPNPVGSSRVYVHFSGPLSPENWYGALHESSSFVTNGPILFFTLDPTASGIKATVDTRAREPIQRVEIVADGEIIHSFRVPQGSKNFKGSWVVDPKKYSWIAARSFLKPADTIRLAHTSPIVLDDHADCRKDAEYFLRWIDDLITQTKADTKRFASAKERDEVLGVYERARAVYETKLAGCSTSRRR